MASQSPEFTEQFTPRKSLRVREDEVQWRYQLTLSMGQSQNNRAPGELEE